MKIDKKIRFGRISIQFDGTSGKITGISLHQDSEFPEPQLPEKVKKLAEDLNSGFAGEKIKITSDDLDLSIMRPFQRKILLCLYHNVPAGKVITYRKLAELAGHPGASRAVGTAMSGNPFPLLLPCHRVIPSSGYPGRFGSGTDMKIEMLKAEGVTFTPEGMICEKQIIR